MRVPHSNGPLCVARFYNKARQRILTLLYEYPYSPVKMVQRAGWQARPACWDKDITVRVRTVELGQEVNA